MSAVASSGLYAVDMSRKAQAGKQDAADVAAFPCAERWSRAACLKLRDAAFTGRSLGSQEYTLEHPSPSGALGSIFQSSVSSDVHGVAEAGPSFHRWGN